MTTPESAQWWRASGTAPRGGVGLFGVIAPNAQALEAAARSLELPPMAPGSVKLVSVLGVDDVVAARASSCVLWLCPHAGRAVAERMESWLTRAGLAHVDDQPSRFAEARSLVEARALSALARAASPRSVDLLLAQHDLWTARHFDEAAPPSERDRLLGRLLAPPMVVCIGKPNAGKSTLLNALAGQTLAVASSVAGTTLDHVGVMLELDGLVVRWLDTAGLGEIDDADERRELHTRAQAQTHRLAQTADLVLHISEAAGGAPKPMQGLAHVETRTLASKIDLAAGGDRWQSWADAGCSAVQPATVRSLALAIRRWLVPDAVIEAAEPWRFWM